MPTPPLVQRVEMLAFQIVRGSHQVRYPSEVQKWLGLSMAQASRVGTSFIGVSVAWSTCLVARTLAFTRQISSGSGSEEKRDFGERN